ncbi:MAG: hypothetical protein KatS3mg104_1652 [Phycisphaerae bacterium]|nr:MAG: hypothetical protein KatS3mg104_1652 [Phycisphaerae bacterium]
MVQNGINQLQVLESRCLMSAGSSGSDIVRFGDGHQLILYGTRRDDVIQLYFTGDTYLVRANNQQPLTFTQPFNSVRIIGGKGNDVIKVDASVMVPAYLHGGNGNDTLCGGSGQDFLYGDQGIDRLYGNAGNDQIITIGGGNRDLVTGGKGLDSFWMDLSSREKLIDPSADEWKVGSVNRVKGFQSSSATNGQINQSVSTELLGQRINDPTLTNGTYVYESFNRHPLFSSRGPSMDDVKQGQIGDCYFLATLAGAAHVSPDSIRSMITDLGDGTYAVRFANPDNSYRFYRVDNDLPVSREGSNRPVYAGLGNEDCLWVALAEKAYTYHRNGSGSYESIHGGWMSQALTAIGARQQETLWRQQSGGAQPFIHWVEQQLSEGKIVTLGVLDAQDDLNLVSGHAYTVDSVKTDTDGSKYLIIRNPWAIDGYTCTDRTNDGYLRLTPDQAYRGINVFVSGRAA